MKNSWFNCLFIWKSHTTLRKITNDTLFVAFIALELKGFFFIYRYFIRHNPFGWIATEWNATENVLYLNWCTDYQQQREKSEGFWKYSLWNMPGFTWPTSGYMLTKVACIHHFTRGTDDMLRTTASLTLSFASFLSYQIHLFHCLFCCCCWYCYSVDDFLLFCHSKFDCFWSVSIHACQHQEWS